MSVLCSGLYYHKKTQEPLGSKLCFVFRNFPVTKVRPHAYETALAAETAAAQGFSQAEKSWNNRR